MNILHIDRKSWVREPGVLHPVACGVVAAGGAEVMGVLAGHINEGNTHNMPLHIVHLSPLTPLHHEKVPWMIGIATIERRGLKPRRRKPL